MNKRTTAAKKGDALLSIMALLVVGGLCLKGMQTLYWQEMVTENKEGTTALTQSIVDTSQKN